MENIFFGGISQYEENAGTPISNKDVPFTKAIAKVSREKDGKMIETKIADLPEFLGAGAEFLINSNLPTIENEIVKINEVKADRVLLGHIVGGIHSTRKTVFFSNSGRESSASNSIYKVWLTRIPKQNRKLLPRKLIIRTERYHHQLTTRPASILFLP